MSNKEKIIYCLYNHDWETLKHELAENPKLVRHLFPPLYNEDENIRWLGVKGFGIAAQVFEEERLKDLLRRMMWSLNDESGSNSWFTPQAIGEIGYYRPEIVKDFLPCLNNYAQDEDEILSKGAAWAVNRVTEGLEIAANVEQK